VGSALVSLYSRYLNLVQKNTSQLSLFIYDQLAAEFSTLGEMIKRRIALEELLALYEIEGSSADHDGEQILVLGRKERTKTAPSVDGFKLCGHNDQRNCGFASLFSIHRTDHARNYTAALKVLAGNPFTAGVRQWHSQ
jgi:hypothetical protein